MGREHVHLIGIGGTGMTALAGLLVRSGCRVTGSDRQLYPPTSTILKELGLDVASGFDAANLRPAPDLVVVGNAVSRGNPEAEEMLDRGLAYTSMPRIVSERFLSRRHSIVVAGTHGKTTTTSMLAWILTRAGRDPGFLIGGMPLNFERPFSLGSGEEFVIEGDEYDTAFFDKGPKFMHYRPNTALLGTVEFDHADIYRDLDEVLRVFGRLVNLVPRSGLLVRNDDCALTRQATVHAPSRVAAYGIDSAGDWQAREISIDEAGTHFLLFHEQSCLGRALLPVAGEHNVLNALAATAAAHDRGVTTEQILDGLRSFAGVSRRLETRGEVDGVTVLDDFAHHPTAIAETLKTVRRRYPGRRIWAVLEPRSWSLRRNIFQERLSQAFDAADQVLIAAVFRAEDVPAEIRLDPHRLVAEISARGGSARFMEDAASIVGHLENEACPGDVVLFMSNGGFDGIHQRLIDALGLRARSTERG